jgi:hypothetical protein
VDADAEELHEAAVGMARPVGRAAGGDGIGLEAMSGSGEIGGGMMIISKLWLQAARARARSVARRRYTSAPDAGLVGPRPVGRAR